jgi:hypothetical protein
MRMRDCHGSFIAENAAMITVIFLALTFPLINLATSTYRYNMVCGAAKAAAHVGANAPTFSGNAGPNNPATGNGAMQTIPAMVDHYLKDAKGISNVSCKYRINIAKIDDQTVTNNPWSQQLPNPADLDNFIYSMEVVVDADVAPLVTMTGSGLIPNVPGLTGPTHQSVAAQEVVETTAGLNQ